MRTIQNLLVAGALMSTLGCGPTATDSGPGTDSSPGTDTAVATDSGPGSDSAVGTDASTDSGVGTDSAIGTDSAMGSDSATAITHYGVVSVGDVANAGFVGQIRGAFVPAADLPILTGGRNPIAAAPGCYEILPPPPVVPMYMDAGTLFFEGLILAMHSVMPGMGGDYSFDYANLLDVPGNPITLTVPGAAVIEPMMASVPTPDPAQVSTWTLGSTGVFTSWTAGNGDYVLLRFNNSVGVRECEVPDTGSFLIPAAAFNPDAMPAGGVITFQRVIETIVLSPSGAQELRFRAFSEDQML